MAFVKGCDDGVGAAATRFGGKLGYEAREQAADGRQKKHEPRSKVCDKGASRRRFARGAKRQVSSKSLEQHVLRELETHDEQKAYKANGSADSRGVEQEAA